MSVIQRVFNAISLQKDEMLWMSDDDSRLEDRLRLIAEFKETGPDFAGALDGNAGPIKMCGKNQKVISKISKEIIKSE